jgi:uncharacterized damage-inducible protein DinB
MAGAGVSELLYVLGEAFDGRGIEESGESQALLTNLSTVDERAWRAVPPGGTRTIEAMVLHVGTCKVMYDDYAFGDGRLQWGTPEVQPWDEGSAPMAEVLEWLRTAHGRFVDHVAALGEEELERPRLTNWGEMRPTRWIVAAIVGHDFYHAGEINHVRSLLSGEDRWLWVQQVEGSTPSS